MNNGHEVYIDEGSIYAITPEGKCGSMSLAEFFEKIAAPQLDLGKITLPKGVIGMWTQGNSVIWLYEREPQPYSFRWIANDSTARYGRDARYRDVIITLPYLEVFLVFSAVTPGRLTLTSFNEAFFSTKPITSAEDELFFPALLNCSKINDPSRPLSWICTQYLDRSFDQENDLNRRMRRAHKSLLRTLLESAFNESSEAHEGASFFGESKHLDERISTIEKWEAASREKPLFVLDVKWLTTGLTVGQLVHRTFNNLKAARPSIKTTADIARVIFNQKTQAPAPLLAPSLFL